MRWIDRMFKAFAILIPGRYLVLAILLVLSLSPALRAQAVWSFTPQLNQNVTLVAGSASASQYGTNLVPALVPQVTVLDFAHYAPATGTIDSAIVPANALAGLHGLWIRARGITSANSGSTKSVKMVINGATRDSVKVTASSANVWELDCFIGLRTPGSSGVQTTACTGVSSSATPTVNLITVDTLTINPTTTFVIKTVGSDSVAGDVAQDLLVITRQP